LLLAVLVVCIQQIDGVFAAAIKGLERFKQQALFELCSRLTVTGAAIAAACLTHDLCHVLLANCATSLVSALLRGGLLRTLAPAARIFALPSRSEISRILSFGGWMWLNATATAAYGSVDRIIVGRFLGTAAAAQFHIYAQVSQFIHYIPSSVFAFSFPVFSRLSAGGTAQRAELAHMYRQVLSLIVVSAVAIGTVLTLLRHDIMGLFAARGFAAGNDSALLLLICGFVVLALNIAPYYLLLGLGRSRTVSIITALSVLMAIVLALVLVPRLGLEGAALARFGYVLGTLLLLQRAHYAMRTVEIQ
jgi:O-antigen/teichoic acid export membrane protein